MGGSRRWRLLVLIWLVVVLALGAYIAPHLVDDSNFRGQLLDGENGPVGGVTIHALDPTTGDVIDTVVSDDDGGFRVHAVPDGLEYHFAVVLDDALPRWRTVVRNRRYVRMLGGSTVRENIWLPSEITVTGRVVDPSGAPLADAWVSLHPELTEGLGISRQTETYADGTFAVFLDEADMSLRRVRASVHPVGFMPAYEILPANRLVAWDHGRVADFGEIVVEPAGLAVGHVFDESSQPVEGATVTVFSIGPEVPEYEPEWEEDTFWGMPWSGTSGARPGGPRILSLSTNTERDGAFALTVLFPVHEAIAVVMAGGRPGLRIPIPAEQLVVGQPIPALREIQLPEPRPTRFRLVDTDGRPIASTSNVFVNWIDPLRDGMDIGVASLATDLDGWTSTSAIAADDWYRLHLNFRYAPTKVMQIADGATIVLEAK